MTSEIIKVAIVGATGQTGSVIVQALLESTAPKYVSTALFAGTILIVEVLADNYQEVMVLTRPSSLQKPAVLELAKQGVHIVSADLAGPQEALEKTLLGVDVVISTIYGGNLMEEIPLANASKSAGVKRYLPCFFATVAPPKGALLLREMVSCPLERDDVDEALC